MQNKASLSSLVSRRAFLRAATLGGTAMLAAACAPAAPAPAPTTAPAAAAPTAAPAAAKPTTAPAAAPTTAPAAAPTTAPAAAATAAPKPQAAPAQPAPAVVVDGNVLEDAYQALVSLGNSPIEARTRLDRVFTGGCTFSTVEEVLRVVQD